MSRILDRIDRIVKSGGCRVRSGFESGDKMVESARTVGIDDPGFADAVVTSLEEDGTISSWEERREAEEILGEYGFDGK